MISTTNTYNTVKDLLPQIMSQLPVRTTRDDVVHEREERLRREFDVDVSNPFRQAFLRLNANVITLYNHVRAPGVMLGLTLWWGLYPQYARFRHNAIKRFGRRQVDYRKRFFHTRNIPKTVDPNEERRSWRGWALFFVFARWFQQATEMPEMPDFPL